MQTTRLGDTSPISSLEAIMDQPFQMPTSRYEPAIDSHFPRVNQTYPIDVSIARKSWVVLHPTNHDTDYLKDSFVEFMIDSEQGSFIDFGSFNIEYNLRLLKADGTPVAGDAALVLTNGLIHTLSTSRKLFLNTELIESDYQTNYTQYVNFLTTTDVETIIMQGKPMGYFHEEDVINATNEKAAFVAAGESYIPRRIKYAKQENIQLYGPLNLDIGKSNMMMIDRVNARLHLELADTSQLVLKASDDATIYKIKIFSVKLHFKRITPVENAYLELNTSLLSNNLEYNFERNLVYKTTVGINQRQVFLSQIFGTLIPNKLHIMMVNQKASIGDDKLNSHYFGHFKLDNIRVSANGLTMLDSDVSFTNKYSALYQRSTDALRTKAHSIPFGHFNTGRTIITVDCQNSETNSIMQIEKRGRLEIHMKFSAPLAEAINIIILGTTVGSVELDKDRRVTTHYNY